MGNRTNVLRAALVGVIALGLLARMPVRAQGPDDGNGLPLLAEGLHVAVSYPEATPEAASAVEAAFGTLLGAGLDTYELSFAWSDLEPSPGVIDTSTLEEYLAILDILNLKPYFLIKTIDTVNLNLPSDLLTAQGELADGRHFDDPEIVERFAAVLDAVVPLLAEHDGFFLSVGNEIDGWLPIHPQEVEPFLNFTAAARAHVHTLAPAMGVGATVMFDGVQAGYPWIDRLIAASDAAVFTYYPLQGDFTVRDPDVIVDDLAAMVAAAGDRPLLLQEVGYPSGYLPQPSNGSSVEKQKQFVENLFRLLPEYPQIRFVSFLSLVDWPDATCDHFLDYYGVSAPAFREYLCSLGLLAVDGTPKPAFAAFRAGLSRVVE